MRAVGDEDCGVSLVCDICDTGGKPEAYYEGICGNPYPDVLSAGSIQEPAELERRHLREVHDLPAVFLSRPTATEGGS